MIPRSFAERECMPFGNVSLVADLGLDRMGCIYIYIYIHGGFPK